MLNAQEPIQKLSCRVSRSDLIMMLRLQNAAVKAGTACRSSTAYRLVLKPRDHLDMQSRTSKAGTAYLDMSQSVRPADQKLSEV